MEIPEGYHGQIHARSSTRQQGIEISEIIDSDYRGVIGLVVKNTN
jgi:dUTPase